MTLLEGDSWSEVVRESLALEGDGDRLSQAAAREASG